MNKNDPTAGTKRQKREVQIIGVIIAAAIVVGIALFFYSDTQTARIRNMLNESAYSNMENTLTNLENMIDNVFRQDQEELKILASGCSDMDDVDAYVQKLEYPSDRNGIYYGKKDAKTAVGKNGQTLDLTGMDFVEHANGIVRSRPYMTHIADYAYTVRVPVTQNDEITGYLYAEHFLTGFSKVMPRDEAIAGNDYSIMAADSMSYVYTPMGAILGSHINFKRLHDYLTDQNEAAIMTKEIDEALKNKEYYMKIATMRNIYEASRTDDYVLFLWPVDDGEYYITGVVKVSSLQSERIDVEQTIRFLMMLILGFSILFLIVIAGLFTNSLRVVRNRETIQQKHNEELSEALQIAKAANESKSNFLSNMSHDIRTPMNAIIGFTTLLIRDTTDPKVHEYARKILDAGGYLLNLINDVLDMSRIESGKTKLTITEFSLQDMSRNVSDLIRPQINQKHQTLVTTVEHLTGDRVCGDELRIQQILTNMMSNAVKYTQPGGRIELTIRGVAGTNENYQRLQIIVADNGYGISKEDQKMIFEPFTRVDDTRTDKIQGTGLGLAIVKNIVDLMGGTISVDSEVGKGSRFTVELQLIAAKKAEPHGANQKLTAGTPEEASLEGMHVLAAEDNELNAELLVELLRIEGAGCRICSDGVSVAETFEKSEPGTFDLILMDIQMPNMDGYEATKRIRRSGHPDAERIPIIAMTANAFAEDVQKTLQAGMDAHLAKPVDMNLLKRTVIRVRNMKKKGKKV